MGLAQLCSFLFNVEASSRATKLGVSPAEDTLAKVLWTVH